MGLENREKTNKIFDGSKLNVPGQGIKTVKTFQDILKDKNSLFSPSEIQNEQGQIKPTPQPTKTPRPTPNNTPTQTTTPSFTPTMTKSGRAQGTPLPTRTSTKTPVSSSTPTTTLTPSKTVGTTPIPTRTNTPSNTQTGTIGLTPSTTLNSTPNATPSYTPSVTQTLTPNGCFCYDIEITQSDLNLAYGNTEQIANGIITIQYFSCSEEFITLTATTAGIYKICNRKFETLDSFGVEALLVYTQLDEVYNNYLNPSSFSSTVTTLYNSCSILNDCIPPTTTPTMTQTQTPTNSMTMSLTPSYTPTNTITPSYTPTNQPTPNPTPTNTQTPTITPYICYSYDVTITQTDIDRASGNTGTNGVVSITYYSCDEVVEELEITVAGTYTVCNKYIKTNTIYNTEIYLVYTQDDEAYNNYDNPEKFTSSFVRTTTICPTEPPPPPPPPCNPLDFEPLSLINISNPNGSAVLVRVVLSSNPLIIIDWGDGNIENYTQYSLNLGKYTLLTSHTFTSNSSGIKIYCCYFDLISELELRITLMTTPKFTINFSEIGQKLVNIEYILIQSGVIVVGDISSISNLNNLTELIFQGNGQTVGIIESIPNSLTKLQALSTHISGNLNNITNTSLIIFEVSNSSLDTLKSFIDGDVITFINSCPNLLRILINGEDTIYGNLSLLTNNVISSIILSGNNTITGDISFIPQSVQTFKISGFNTIYGDIGNLTQNIIIFVLYGDNTVNGDIANLPANNIVQEFIINGYNTISGDISNFPNYPPLRKLSIQGYNTLSGSLNNLTIGTKVFFIEITGFNTITGPVNQFMANILNGQLQFNKLFFSAIYPGGLISNEVDFVLNELVNRQFSPPTNLPSIRFIGSNQPRTSASDIAVNHLQSIGVSVQTN